jgi:anti-anti-sigma factor
MYKLSHLFIMSHPDEDLQRRGQNLLTILYGLIILALLSLPISLVNGRIGPVINAVLVLPLGAGLIILAHQGRVGLVALIMIIVNTLSLTLVPVFASAQFSIIAYYFIINILIAGVVMHPRAIWATLALNLAALTLAAMFARQVPEEAPSILVVSLNAGLLIAFATLIAILSTTTTMRALHDMRQARAEVQQANGALADRTAGLEQQVAERTAVLSATLADREAQAITLQEALTNQKRLNDLILDLSLPVIPVTDDTLVVPLVGALDSVRADLMLQRVLAEIEAQRVRTLILDVTGLSIIDTQVAQVLLNIAQAARLLGTSAILVGIRPEVAQALVSLGVELPNLQTYATLQQALRAPSAREQRASVWA